MASKRFAVALAFALLAPSSAEPFAAEAFGHWIRKEADASVHTASTSSWSRIAPADPDQMLTLTVALHVDTDRRSELERVFYEVSDPDHPKYGRHLSQADVTRLLAVPATRAQETSAYFQAAGARSVEVAPNGDMVTVTIPVVSTEAALNTKLHVFQHSARASAVVVRASRPYYLPAKIADHVTMVGELLQFPRLRSPGLVTNTSAAADWPNKCSSSQCKNLVTPWVLAQRYKLPEQSASVPNNSMAVAEFQGQFYQRSDLQAFGQSCHRDVVVEKTVGQNSSSGGIESELDIEYIKSVAPEIPLTVIYNSDYSLLSWANQISSMQHPPLVHSVSYGNDEIQQTSTQYMFTCNTAFMKAGVRGLSILFASGDQGVCGRSGCDPDFNPDFPGASPYITAVGGTDFLGSRIGAEMAWSSGGGGFSNTFSVPAYQAKAVAAYKASPDAKLPPQKLWNNTGRGYPDVAALGGLKNAYCVYVDGLFQGVAGTSAASPVVAGVFAKLNGLRLSKGKAPLGFLNPFIYKNPGAFQDVKAGDNNAGGQYGFTAIKGWDAATGFGTPDFEALSSAVAALDVDGEATFVV